MSEKIVLFGISEMEVQLEASSIPSFTKVSLIVSKDILALDIRSFNTLDGWLAETCVSVPDSVWITV
jgi:hypothetical protein